MSSRTSAPPARVPRVLAVLVISLILAGLSSSPSFAATIYRCQGPKGVVFSQTPCGDNAEKRAMASEPAPVGDGTANGSAAAERGGESSESDAAWAARVRVTWNETCQNTAGMMIPGMAPELVAETCSCGLERYLRDNSIPVLREIEAQRDVQRNSMLMRPAMIACYRELEASYRREGRPLLRDDS